MNFSTWIPCPWLIGALIGTVIAACFFDPLFGTVDLLSFWGAAHVFWAGGDPYNREALSLVQAVVLKPGEPPNIFPNPPWALTVLFPLSLVDFAQARFLWAITSALIALWSALTLRRLLCPQLSAIALGVGLFIFLPLFAALHYGQLSVLLLLGITLVIAYPAREHPWLRAMALVLLLLKPHSVYLPLFFIVLRQLSLRELRSLVYAFGLVILFSAIPVLVRPRIFAEWPWVLTVSLGWRTASLTTYVRDLFATTSGGVPQWPVVAVPLLTLLICLLIALRRRKLFSNVPELALISVLTAPYIWVYDMVILLPLWLQLLNWRPLDGNWQNGIFATRFWVVGSIIAGTLVATLASSSFETFIVFPWLLAIWRFGLTRAGWHVKLGERRDL